MPINVKDSHPIILGESLLPWRLLTIQLGFFHEHNNWSMDFNPLPSISTPNMSSVFSVDVKYHNPFIVVGYKDPKNPIVQLFNVSTNQWLIRKFQPNFNG